MSVATITVPVPAMPVATLPRVLPGEPNSDLEMLALSPEHPAGTHKPIALDPAVAKHFTAKEKSAASAWLAQHPEVPPATDGPKVFPDPYVGSVHRELRRITRGERGWGPEAFTESTYQFDAGFDEPEVDGAEVDGAKDEPDERLPDSSAHKKIVSRIEAAEVALRGVEKGDHSIERFMADSDKYLEPYFAFRDGMSLTQIAKTYGVSNVPQLVDAIDRGLDRLERERPYFNRAHFLFKAKRAVNTRRRDARVGTEQAAAERAALVRPAEPESTAKRGAKWATIEHVSVSSAVRSARSVLHWDRPRQTPLPIAANVSIPRDVKAELIDQRRSEMMDSWTAARPLGADAVRVLNIKIPPNRAQKRKSQLEHGLQTILERESYFLPDGSVNQDRRELVDIVDLAKAGMKNPQIAHDLNVPLRTIERRLRELFVAAENDSQPEISSAK